MKTPFQPSREEIEALLRLADENLKLAEIELDHGFPRSVVSKAYYAFLDVARAALLGRGVIPRSHGGCVAEFGRTFVSSGEVSAEYGRWFNRALRARQEADYEALKSFSHEDAAEALDQARRFRNEVVPIVAATLKVSGNAAHHGSGDNVGGLPHSQGGG